MQKLEVFEVVKPQGIKGELKVRLLTDGIDNVKKIKKLFLGETEYTLKSVKDAGGGFAILAIGEILTRNDAETFRGKFFCALKSQILKKDTAYFISDLVGLKVYFNGQKIGQIVEVIKSNVDMFKIKTESGKIAYFPHLKMLDIAVDLDKNTLIIGSERLNEVIYYED